MKEIAKRKQFKEVVFSFIIRGSIFDAILEALGAVVLIFVALGEA